MNPQYESCLKGLLSLEQCIGIIGGKPKHSQYFIGWQGCSFSFKPSIQRHKSFNSNFSYPIIDDYLIHLDPHQCQEMVDVLIPSFPTKSFHCRELRKTSLKHVDPSCCVGFYLRTQRDFDDFRRNVQSYLVPPQSKGDYPIFAFCNGSNPHVETSSSDSTASPPSPLARLTVSGDSQLDDFEFL